MFLLVKWTKICLVNIVFLLKKKIYLRLLHVSIVFNKNREISIEKYLL